MEVEELNAAGLENSSAVSTHLISAVHLSSKPPLFSSESPLQIGGFLSFEETPLSLSEICRRNGATSRRHLVAAPMILYNFRVLPHIKETLHDYEASPRVGGYASSG